jgi:hypothetical protein
MTETTGNSGSSWSIIDQLVNLKNHPKLIGSRIADREPNLEDCLNRVLRPHDEAGFQEPDDHWMIELREEVDQALTALTFREIRNQLGLAKEELPAETRKNLGILFRSEAFLRYLNAYLYFGIRILASRPDSQIPATQTPDSCADSNQHPFALLPPPVPFRLDRAHVHFAEFVSLSEVQESSPVHTALQFLDDFHPSQEESVHYELQEPLQYELYLRGLRPETERDQTVRFEKISEVGPRA